MLSWNFQGKEMYTIVHKEILIHTTWGTQVPRRRQIKNPTFFSAAYGAGTSTIKKYTETDMYITWNKIFEDDLTEAKGKDVTPESLRSAAKVLEDKAKELEKPKRTPYQEAVLKYADERDLHLYSFNNVGMVREVKGLEYKDTAGEFYKLDDYIKTERLFGASRIQQHGMSTYTIHLSVIKNEYDDWVVVVEYPL